MNESSSTAYTQNQATSYEATRFTAPAGQAIHRVEVRLVEAHLPSAGTIVEAGCGTGRLARALSHERRTVIGFDLSEPMLREAQRLTDHPRFALADARRLPLADGTVTALYTVRLLNQVGSPSTALEIVREIARVTAPGAKVVIEFQNSVRPTRKKRSPAVRLRPRQVRASAEQLGLKVIAVRGAFLLGMTSYLRCPSRILPLVEAVDSRLSKALPRLCSRVYLHAVRR